MSLTVYTTGTVSVGAGSTTVTGAGTAFVAAGVREGDRFWANGLSVRIAAAVSNTQLTLATPWPGAALASANYEVEFTPEGQRILASALAVLEQIRSGNVSALSGLSGAANRLPYFTGAGTMSLATLTSAARQLLDDADVAAMRDTLGVPVQTGAQDATAGRLLKVGAFGWGSSSAPSSIVANPNDVRTSGVYSVNNETPNMPLSQWGALLVLVSGTGSVVQMFIPVTSTLAGTVYSRAMSGGGSWTAWQNISGERSSNGNGDYVRFADGTQICNGSVNVTDATSTAGAIFSSAAATWAFPAAFAAAPNVYGQTAESFSWVGMATPGLASVQARVLSASAKSGTQQMRLTAIGRWK